MIVLYQVIQKKKDSICENQEDDNIRGIPSIRDPNGDIEIVVHVGSDTSNDQCSCFTKGGLTGENHFEFPIVDVILLYIDPIRDEV